jgi:hypothetical protein
MRIAFITCILLVFCAAGISSANTIQSGPYMATSPIPYSLTDWLGTLTFPQFDPALGTLTEVDISLTGAMQTQLTVQNVDSELPSSGHTNTHLVFTVQDAGLNLHDPSIDMSGPSFAYSLDPGDSLTSGVLTKSLSITEIYTGPAILAEFSGPGVFSLNASTFTETALFSTGGNTESEQVTEAGLTGTVTYQYDVAVPEPVTMVSALLAAGGLGGYVRHRMTLGKRKRP